MVIPVVREVLVVEKRYEILEEVLIRKTVTEIPNQQQVTLKRESVDITRTSSTR
jgi:stress response protein YsnF